MILFATTTCLPLRGQDLPGPALPENVSEAVFRSRWARLEPEDRQRQSAAALAGLEPGSAEYSQLESAADTLRAGLWLGPVEVHPGISFGWEYSDQNDDGVTTTPGDDNSLFIAPTLSLLYGREIGPWSVAANYGVGWRYYFNPNYTAAGTGQQRNPLAQTASVSLGHLGLRHTLKLAASADSGSGYESSSGRNLVQTNIATSVDYDYLLTNFTQVGFAAAYSASLNEGEDDQQNANLGAARAGVWAEWMATGKVSLRLDLEAGQESQDVQDEGTAQRRFLQALVSARYVVTEKISLRGGLGAAYLTDPGVAEAEYTGLQPRYEIGATYAATEKTSLSASLSLLGADIRPSFRVEARWQPRVNTGLSFAVYQAEAFSLNVVDQVQVSRGVIGTLSQRLFAKIDCRISAGWEQTEDLSLSEGGEAGTESGDETSYGFVSASATWNLAEWSSLQVSWWNSSGGSETGGGSSGSPETRVTVSVNVSF